MHFGTYMGAYWILKFILLPLMFAIPFFQLLYVILTLAVPIIGYYYVKIYRDKVCGGAIQFSHAVLFTIFMYMFASLLVAVAHYIYFQFIDHGFIFNALADFWNQAIEQSPALQENKELMKDMFDADQRYRHYHANAVIGRIFRKYPCHPYRINGNEKRETRKQ